jgi:hypothetical protein
MIGTFCHHNRESIIPFVTKVTSLTTDAVEKVWTTIASPHNWVRWKRVHDGTRIKAIKDVGVDSVTMRIFKHKTYPTLKVAVISNTKTDEILRVLMNENLE